MMERIVLGYDGSPAAAAALSWVVRRANRSVVHVDIISVVPRRATDRSSALDHLAEAETRLRDQAQGTGVALHRLEGDSAEALSVFAEDADILVTGINVGHPVRAWFAGALPLRLSARADVPVVLVPAGWVEVSDPVTVGIAADRTSDSALAFAVTEADLLETSVRLVHSWLMPTPSFTQSPRVQRTPKEIAGEHLRLLDRASNRVADHHPTTTVYRELVRESPSTALLSYASRSSMIVIGTHRRGLLAGGLLGSVAQEILWHAECPVAVVPAATNLTDER